MEADLFWRDWGQYEYDVDVDGHNELLPRSRNTRNAVEMVDWKGRMLNILRTKNEEPIHVPFNDAARILPVFWDTRV
jgi:hypothetical protein